MIDALCRQIGVSAGVRVLPIAPLASRGSLVWRIRFDGEDAVLTQRASQVHIELPDVQRELSVARRAASAHLAPPLLWADAAQRVFICRYVLPAPMDSPLDARALGEQLGRLHRIPVDQFPRAAGLAQIANRYLQIIAAREYDEPAMQRFEALVVRIQNAAEANAADDVVMCHRDLVATNVLHGDRPLFIDWEYAGPCSRWFDVATLLDGQAFGKPQVANVLDGYLQVTGLDTQLSDAHTAIDRQRLVSGALNDLWQAALPAVA
ncbi:MAG: phosphotransferase [Pseudomonadota bacterium]